MPRKKIEVQEFPSECMVLLQSAKDAIEKLDHRIFGNGQPGVVADLQDDVALVRGDIEAVRAKQRQIEADVEIRHQVNLNNAKWQRRLLKIAIATVAIMPMLSGTGVVSLANLWPILQKLAKAFIG